MMSGPIRYYASVDSNGDVLALGSFIEHDDLETHAQALAMIRIDAVVALRMQSDPERWRLVDGKAVPRPPDLIQLAAAARRTRDRLLTASDWTTIADAPLSEAERATWRRYRQALRDVTKQADFPLAIVWPERLARSKS